MRPPNNFLNPALKFWRSGRHDTSRRSGSAVPIAIAFDDAAPVATSAVVANSCHMLDETSVVLGTKRKYLFGLARVMLLRCFRPLFCGKEKGTDCRERDLRAPAIFSMTRPQF